MYFVNFCWFFGWCFILYQAVSQRGKKKRKKIEERKKMSKQPPPAPTASTIGPCPTVIQISRTPGTESLSSTFAPHDHPFSEMTMVVFDMKQCDTVLPKICKLSGGGGRWGIPVFRNLES